MKSLKLLFSLIVVIFAISISSCNDDDDSNNANNVIELKVASTLNVTNGETSLIIRQMKDYNTIWIPYYDNIIGFNYEEGYEYHLKVKKVERPIESSKPELYELIEVISKEKKQTIFNSSSYTISNHGLAEGTKLSSTDKEKIENLIVKSSPFSDAHVMTMNIVEFQKNDEGLFELDNGKTGKYSIAYNDNVITYTFYFNGQSYEYKYVKIGGSPTATPYLLRDLTSDYKADYPELESAILGLGLSRMM